jgi:hypothetical protein
VDLPYILVSVTGQYTCLGLKKFFANKGQYIYRRGQYIYNRGQYIYNRGRYIYQKGQYIYKRINHFCKRGHSLQRKHCVSEECSEFTVKGSLASEGKFCIFTEEDGIQIQKMIVDLQKWTVYSIYRSWQYIY